MFLDIHSSFTALYYAAQYQLCTVLFKYGVCFKFTTKTYLFLLPEQVFGHAIMNNFNECAISGDKSVVECVYH